MALPQLRSDPARGLRHFLVTIFSVCLAWFLVAGGLGIYADFTCEIYPVTGFVHVDGRPPVGAKLEFSRVNSEQWAVLTPKAVVDKLGRFQVTSIANRNGAPAGEYIVTVKWTPEQLGFEGFESGPNLLPARYASTDSSPLLIKVEPRANRLEPMEIHCRCTEVLAEIGAAGARLLPEPPT